MKFNAAVATLALAAVPASAFKVYTYTGDNCASSEDGTATDSLANDQCFSTGAGIAQSAIVQAEDSDGMDDAVAFWDSPGCQGNLVAQAGANSGCIYAPEYQSFNVISGETEARKHRRDDDIEYIFPDDSRYEAYMDMHEEDENELVHGKEEMYHGTMIKWHEEHRGIYSAIPMDEWDDAVHVQNKKVLTFGVSNPIDFTNASLVAAPVQERDLNGLCDAFKNCADTVRQNADGFLMRRVIPAAVNAYVRLNNGVPEVWNYIVMNRGKAIKFTYTTAGTIATGVISSYIYNALKDATSHKDVAGCSTQGTEAATIYSTVTHTVTETSRVTSVQTILEDKAGNRHRLAFQLTSGSCLNCYEGECGAADTKRSLQLGDINWTPVLNY